MSLAILDTSVWFALSSLQDDQHDYAVSLFNFLDGIFLPITVIEEFLAVSQSRFGKRDSLVELDRMKSLVDAEFVSILHLENQELLEVLKKYKDYPNYIDFVDASVLYFCKKLSVPIFGFDKHFEKCGANLYR